MSKRIDGFRLLNSEIGNDQIRKKNGGKSYESFRLLNSEIGNDLSAKSTQFRAVYCFRLLNSEIGNDQVKVWFKQHAMCVFVSLTRR